ncbi:MAG TPA: SsgA family sporulation/cell division regulator [Candidatus Saccharimonadia bacterium]
MSQYDIEIGVLLWQLVSGANTTPRSAILRYRADDPFAVSLLLTSGDGPVEWVFARSLLDRGLKGSAGEGNVRTCISWYDGPPVLIIKLNPTNTTLIGGAHDLHMFLIRTYAVVDRSLEENPNVLLMKDAINTCIAKILG